MHFSISVIGFIALVALFFAATPPSFASVAEPGEADVQAALHELLVCGSAFTGMGQAGQGGEAERQRMVLAWEHLQRKHRPADDPRSALTGEFKAFGAVFDTIEVGGSEHGAGVFAYSSKGELGAVQAALAKRGFELKAGSVEGPGGMLQALTQRRIDYDGTLELTLYAGRFSQPERGSGLTLLCGVGATSETDAQRMFGIPSLRSIENTLSSGLRQAPAWADQLLAKNFDSVNAALARYRWLSPAQTTQLIAQGPGLARLKLVQNTALALEASHIDALVALGESGVLRLLAQHRYAALSSAHKTRMRQDPAAAEMLAVREDSSLAVAALIAALKSGDFNRGFNAIFRAPLSAPMVDAVLSHGSDALRESMAMQSQTAYTPEQVERMLLDPVTMVAVGVLRRREVKITPEQIERGLKFSTGNLRFWYEQRAADAKAGR